MEGQQPWRTKLTYKNATILVCFLNLVFALLLLHGFFAGPDRRLGRAHQLDPAQIRFIMESEAMRRAMEPVDLIRRLKEIEQEAYTDTEIEIKQLPKQTAAVDLSKKLKDRATNDANNQKALEEWRKRKVERARQREIEKNGTVGSLA